MRWLQPIQRLDVALFYWCMARRRRETLTAFGRAVSKTADGHLYLLFALGYWLIAPAIHGPFVAMLVMAFATERALYWVMKNSCRRNRPADALRDFTSFIVPSDKFSFPSGHTSAAFLFVWLVGSQFPTLFPFLLGWAACVGLSRVFLGVHFPTDTVVGAALGSSVAFGFLMQGVLL